MSYDYAHIEFNGERVRLRYTETNPNGVAQGMGLSCEEPPRAELSLRLQDFAAAVLGYHAWPDSYREEMLVQGVTYRRNTSGLLEALVFTGSVRLPDRSWWTFRSAAVPLDHGHLDELRRGLEHEASLYINGCRAQGSLFDQVGGQAPGHGVGAAAAAPAAAAPTAAAEPAGAVPATEGDVYGPVLQTLGDALRDQSQAAAAGQAPPEPAGTGITSIEFRLPGQEPIQSTPGQVQAATAALAWQAARRRTAPATA